MMSKLIEGNRPSHLKDGSSYLSERGTQSMQLVSDQHVVIRRLLAENEMLKKKAEFLQREVDVLNDAVSYNWGIIEARSEKDERITRVILENRRLKKLAKHRGART